MTAATQAIELFTGVMFLCFMAYVLGRIASHQPVDSRQYRRKWLAVRQGRKRR